MFNNIALPQKKLRLRILLQEIQKFTFVTLSTLVLGGSLTIAQAESNIPFAYDELNLLSDNTAAYLIKAPGSLPENRTILSVGDRIRGTFRIETIEDLTGTQPTAYLFEAKYPELTAIYDITLVSKEPVPGASTGIYFFKFGPTPSLIANLFPGPATASGTMIRLYEDDIKNYSRLLESLEDDDDPLLLGEDTGIGGFITEGILDSTATGGASLWDMGFTGQPNTPTLGEGWESTGVDNIGLLRGLAPASAGASFYMALNITKNHAGIPLGLVFSSFGGTVTFNGSGSILGVLGVATPYDFFGNLDFVIRPISSSPEIIIEKIPDAEPPTVFAPGDTAYFEIKVSTTGDGTAYNLILIDNLPNDSRLDPWAVNVAKGSAASIDCTIAPATPPPEAAQQLNCPIGDLALGETFTVHVEALVLSLASFSEPLATVGLSDFNATDGNLTKDNSAIPNYTGPNFDTTDWENFKDQINCQTNEGCVYDTPSGKTDNSYTRGAKEDDKNPATDFGSIPPSKDDLLRWYFVNDIVGDDAFLYLAWVRSNELATATIDFELNQSGELKSNGVNPVRTEGDALIVYDFRGGRVDRLDLLRWLTSTDPANTDDDCEANSASVAEGCWGKITYLIESGFAEGAVNFDDNGTQKPGDDGFPAWDPIEEETLNQLRFGEAAINLTAAFVSAPEDCIIFSQAFVKSRASSSFTAELKDFIMPVPVSISTCKDVPNTASVNGENTIEVTDDGVIFINSVVGENPAAD